MPKDRHLILDPEETLPEAGEKEGMGRPDRHLIPAKDPRQRLSGRTDAMSFVQSTCLANILHKI